MRSFVFSLCLILSLPAFAQSKKELKAEVNRLKAEVAQLKKPKEAVLDNKHKEASYAIGVMIASNIKMQKLDSLDVESLVFAIEDVMQDDSLKINETESSQKVQRYMQEAMEARTRKAKEGGVAFLESNKTKEGVKVTDSGLQYKVINEGTGKTPSATDKVTVHYTGKLTDGTVFDSSLERGEPITFNVDGVISGWTEALQLMKEGSKWMLYIPSDLAYGDRGAPPQIPPFSTLIFEVELLKVN